MYTHELKTQSPSNLLRIAETHGITHAVHLNKHELIWSILKHKSKDQTLYTEGTLEILPDGFGFLRSADTNYLPSRNDIYVCSDHIKSMHLKSGDVIEGMIKVPEEGERYFSLTKVIKINFHDPHKLRQRIPFEQLTPLFPTRKINLEPTADMTKSKDIALRMIDIIAPIGFGQRALIVAPPRTGKTVIMQTMIKAIMHHHPDVHLIVLLVDERPEEVTEMVRIVKNGEVISSTFDEPCVRHVKVAEMVCEKAKRLVETGKDVIIFLDSITRLARAYNSVIPSSGKVLTGGVDSNALQKPKRIFGAARNVEEGGSLTIVATALVETGSRMDEVIFEEFKGTGNAEIILDRKLADRRIFPAVDAMRSGTRREEFFVEPVIINKTRQLRRILSAGSMSPMEITEFLSDKIQNTKSNAEFFDIMNKTSHSGVA